MTKKFRLVLSLKMSVVKLIPGSSDIILRLCDEINSLKLKLQDYETTMNEFKIQKQNLYSVTSEDDQINVIEEILSKDVNN